MFLSLNFGKKNPGINPAAAACSFTGSNSPSARDNSVVVGRLQAELTHPALNSLLPAVYQELSIASRHVVDDVVS